MENAVVQMPKQEVAATPSNSPMEAYQALLAQGGNLENIEKMMELQERWEKNEAKKAYTQAMAAFKASPPQINKDKRVDFTTAKGRTTYDHASLGNVTAKINSALAAHGLSAGWKTDQAQSGITVTCTITHKLGYSESTSLTAGAETSGTKNNIQAIGSTITYLQRYTLLALTGLATHDQDDDGQKAEIKLINEKQVSTITDMINEHIEDPDHFLAWVSGECKTDIASVEQIPASAYGIVMSALKAVEK